MEIFKYIVFTYGVCIGVVVMSKILLETDKFEEEDYVDNREQMKEIAENIFKKSYSINNSN